MSKHSEATSKRKALEKLEKALIIYMRVLDRYPEDGNLTADAILRLVEYVDKKEGRG